MIARPTCAKEIRTATPAWPLIDARTSVLPQRDARARTEDWKYAAEKLSERVMRRMRMVINEEASVEDRKGRMSERKGNVVRMKVRRRRRRDHRKRGVGDL